MEAPVSIEQELQGELVKAMKARDGQTLNVVRQILSRVKEMTTAKGFDGEVDDALHLTAIQRYCKQMTKALPDYQAAGERGASMVEQLQYELEYLDRYLPKRMSEEETRTLVADVVASTGATDPSQMGRVMGAIMGQHRDSVDPGLVKRLVDEALAG
jgi:uncharacterized protein YqeY